MKKIIAIIMSLALLLGCCGAVAAEENGKLSLGTISINGAFNLQCGLPEGYRIQPIKMTREQILAVLVSDVPENPVMQLSVAFDETYSDVDRMNDLDEEAFELLEKTFTDVDPTVEITYGDTGLGTRLLIAIQREGSFHYIDFLSIYKGYFIEFAMVPSQTAADKTLTEEQMRMCIDFLTDLDFVPVNEAAMMSHPSVAGLSYIANLSDYDPETNTLRAVLRHTVTMTPEEAAALKVGDTLELGDQSIHIETIEKDEDGWIMINDDVSLRQYGDDVHIYLYEAEYLEDMAEMRLEVPENLVFLDGIDPATGEMLDEITTHTAAEFIAMLCGEDNPEDPGFASDNTRVSFDENEHMTLVQREYVPWQ